MAFIIGSGSSEFKEDINAIMEILNEFGIKGYFALLGEEAKGLDAFCDKICSKIRDAQFCVALLNDPVVPKHVEGTVNQSKFVRAPSANVYYEFGMAVALGKNVIPAIRKGLELPFDVQHLDAIVYADLDDLKKKLRKSIVATLKKKPKEVSTASSDLVKLIYGPLYNEIDRFLLRIDTFTQFTRNEYGTIMTQYKYLLDTIDADLQKRITSFYEEIDEFNSLLPAAERIINEIVSKQISDMFKIQSGYSLSISVELETESGSCILPQLSQILIRKTTPELFLQVQGSHEIIRKITGKLKTLDLKTAAYTEKEIDPKAFKSLFQKCRKKVEGNPRIALLKLLAGIYDDTNKQALHEFVSRILSEDSTADPTRSKLILAGEIIGDKVSLPEETLCKITDEIIGAFLNAKDAPLMNNCKMVLDHLFNTPMEKHMIDKLIRTDPSIYIGSAFYGLYRSSHVGSTRIDRIIGMMGSKS